MCKCGNKKCKVAALAAKTADLKARAEANPSNPYRSIRTRQEITYRNHGHALESATAECNSRQRLLAIGPTCPLCQRPVAPYGAEWSADTCQIGGRLAWRGGWSGERTATTNRDECLSLAWARLSPPPPFAPQPQ